MASHKTVKLLFALLVLGNVLFAAVVFLGGIKSARPKPAMPNPNGYNTFVNAGKQVFNANSFSNSMSQSDLQPLVNQNRPALALARSGFTNQSRVPDNYSPTYVQDSMGDLGSFKELAISFTAEGLLAELKQQTNAAAASYLDAIRLGQESTRGGVLIWRLVGIACESLGLQHLERLHDRLNAQEARQVAQSLEKIDANEESIEDTLAHEKLFSQKAFGWRGRLTAILARKQMEAPKSNFVARARSAQLRRRQAILTFATRAYELDHGKPPQSLSDLVTNYLTTIPKDPITGTNLPLPFSVR